MDIIWYHGGFHEEDGDTTSKNSDLTTETTIGKDFVKILWVNMAAFDRKCWFTSILQLMTIKRYGKSSKVMIDDDRVSLNVIDKPLELE